MSQILASSSPPLSSKRPVSATPPKRSLVWCSWCDCHQPQHVTSKQTWTERAEDAELETETLALSTASSYAAPRKKRAARHYRTVYKCQKCRLHNVVARASAVDAG
eukprot:CAMPEP_0114542952 /NCGR_PEP_ID=MMETSP0114-20121206/2102_1 /TAXON_ID=31324 /ORGANISM="Goniomonas sp, Strain m" /LENGTH=105 /DNA_ID=CAMNT_0001727269 /DNA_START=99 /DNA_END=416 /DNA_ORIENTATION=-